LDRLGLKVGITDSKEIFLSADMSTFQGLPYAGALYAYQIPSTDKVES
jgi:hypothetical protein